MKVLLINNSGNVGKSMLAREVFYQNFPNEERLVLELESRNSSSSRYSMNVERIDLLKPGALGKVTHYGLVYDDIVVDVGASEIERFVIAVEKAPGLLEEFDLIVVPTLIDPKTIADTKKTMMVVRVMGAEKRLRVVFNRVLNPSIVEEEFEDLFAWADKEGFVMDASLYMRDYREAATELSRLKLLSSELLEDATDYRALTIEYHRKGDMEKSRQASDRLLAQRIAASLNAAAKELYEKFDRIVDKSK